MITKSQMHLKSSQQKSILSASSKHNSELQSVRIHEIANMIAIDEVETGKVANQIGTLQKACDTCWGYDFHSVCSLIKMFKATCEVLQSIVKRGSNYSQRGDVDSAYNIITSFDFVFILHVVKAILGITDILCQALQQKSQDILNAMHHVSTTRALILKMREDGWDSFLETTKSFCEKYEIDVPDMSGLYIMGLGRSCHQEDQITIEHHYRSDLFTATIDSQLQELNSRFNEKTMELITLSSALDPKDGFRSFN